MIAVEADLCAVSILSGRDEDRFRRSFIASDGKARRWESVDPEDIEWLGNLIIEDVIVHNLGLSLTSFAFDEVK